MKKINLIFITTLIIILSPTKALAATNLWKFPGVMFKLWDQNNIDYVRECPNCGPMGGIYHQSWKDINPREGNYNFQAIDNYLTQAQRIQTAPFSDGRRIEKPVIIGVEFLLGDQGDLTPAWVYQKPGVAKQTIKCGGNPDYSAPPYNNAQWKEAYSSLIRALSDHFDKNSSLFPNLAGFIISPGYNDEAYPGKPNCEQNVPGYRNFLQELGKVMGESFKNIPAYLPAGGEVYTGIVTDIVLNGNKNHGYKIGSKTNSLSPGGGTCCFSWQENSDIPECRCPNAVPACIVGKVNCATIQFGQSAVLKTNEDISWAMEDARNWPYRCTNQTYYQWMIPLSLHADWIDWRDINVFKTMAEAFPDFTNKFVPSYLGKTKTNTPGAWIGFTDFKSQSTEVNCWKGSSGYACHTHQPGDLQYYLTKVEDTGSKPVWQENCSLTSPLPKQTYDFGRELDNGKVIGLKVDNNVWFKNQNNFQIKLIILNSGSGQVVVSVQKKDGGTWEEIITKGASIGPVNQFVEVTRNLADIKLNGNLSNGSDIVIRSVGGSSTIHLLEIKPGNGPAPTNPPVSPQPSITPLPSSSPTPALHFHFFAGGNSITWQTGYPSNISFNQLPEVCPYLSLYQNNYYYPFARDQNEERFSTNHIYYIFCESQVDW